MKFDPVARLAARPTITYDESLPINERHAEIAAAITTHYAPLWIEAFSFDFNLQRWSQPDNPRLPQDFFTNLTPD